MLNVLLTHSYYYRYDPKQWKNKTPFPPLGTLLAAAVVKEQGCELDFWDANLQENHHDIEKLNVPDVFICYDDGFNYLTKMCLTNMRNAVYDQLKWAKANGALTVVCSSDSTDHYKEYHRSGADIVIHGEGEGSLEEILTLKKNGKLHLESIDGISWQNDAGEIVKNKGRKNISNLDQLPSPLWELVDMPAYRKIWAEGGKEFTLNIATTRGCPFKCNWCAKPIYGQRYNSRSPEQVVDEIEYLIRTFDARHFWMCDDIFGLKPKWVQAFREIVKQRELKFTYYIQSRVDLLLREDTIDALSDSGLTEVWVGAESGSQKILDAMDKDTTIAQIEEATVLLKQRGIKVCYFIQFGYLGETKEDIELTIDLIKRMNPSNIGVSVSYPLPGTKFYEKVKLELGNKKNWTDSDELAMMFKGTFNSKFYKNLHRLVHCEFRFNQGIEHLRRGRFSPSNAKSILALPYYLPIIIVRRMMMKKLNNQAV